MVGVVDQAVLTMVKLLTMNTCPSKSCMKTRPMLRIALRRSVTFAEVDDNAENSKRQSESE